MNLIIRKIIKQDASQILALIHELAVFEKAPNEVINTEAQIVKDGFGPQKIFDGFVAVIDQQIIGLAITYYRYSTWKGKCLYLEDLVVKQQHRNKGVGKKLMEACLDFARDNHCNRMNWQVLDWNESAINFYRGFGTQFDNQWINCSVQLDV